MVVHRDRLAPRRNDQVGASDLLEVGKAHHVEGFRDHAPIVLQSRPTVVIKTPLAEAYMCGGGIESVNDGVETIGRIGVDPVIVEVIVLG